ncbi:MAG: T9SS type A sorting domain-containing protein [Bacteroidia bacterium]
MHHTTHLIKGLITTMLIAISMTGYAQVNTFYVAPVQTDIQYSAVQDSHLVVRNTSSNIDKLFLFLGGTNSTPDVYRTISNFAGNLGFDVINLSYPNAVAAAILANNTDSLIFNTYRQEVCYGTPISPRVNVDSLNSIYTRTVKLLTYLNVTYPNQNWSQYLTGNQSLNWSKIVVSGHSQGSGHACYFGKSNMVERVIMFSGPNDYSNHFSNSGAWLRAPGLTNLDRHFSYLSLLDEIVDFDKQLANMHGLQLFPRYDTTHIDNVPAPYNNSHCLYTTQRPGLSLLYHNAPVRFSTLNNAVWTYMLTSPIVSNAEVIEEKNSIEVYPNPTKSLAKIVINKRLERKAFRILSPDGQVLKTGNISTTDSFSIDFSTFSNGLYFVEIDGQIKKVIKY